MSFPYSALPKKRPPRGNAVPEMDESILVEIRKDILEDYASRFGIDMGFTEDELEMLAVKKYHGLIEGGFLQ